MPYLKTAFLAILLLWTCTSQQPNPSNPPTPPNPNPTNPQAADTPQTANDGTPPNVQPQPVPEVVNIQTPQNKNATPGSNQQTNPDQKKKMSPGMIKNIAEKLEKVTPEMRQKFEQKLARESRQAYELYLKYKQKLTRQQAEELKTLQAEALPNMSDEQKLLYDQGKETLEFRKKYMERTQQHLSFELQKSQKNDFQITIPVDQSFRIYFHVFMSNDGAFSRVTQIKDKNERIRVEVYENTYRLIHDKTFFASHGINIDGKANTTYLVRLKNEGDMKLIILEVSPIIEAHAVKEVVTAQDVANHAERIESVFKDISQRAKNIYTNVVLQTQNQHKLTQGFDHYYYSVIGQMVFILLLCVFQVECIKKLLSSTSVI